MTMNLRPAMKALAVSVLAVALLFATGAGSARAGSYFKAGVLTCSVGAGVGLIVASRKPVSCTFSPRGRVAEYYGGYIRRIGVDVGVTGAAVIVWAVLSSVEGFPVGALAGTYRGLSAEASVGLGLGANVLLGGQGRSFALQPVSVQGQIGLNFAAGVTRLDLYAQ